MDNDLPQMVEISSNNMHSVGFDPDHGHLFVRFKYGKTRQPGALYRYRNVSEDEYRGILDVNQKKIEAKEGEVPPSVSRYFNDHVKSRPNDFPFEKIEQTPGVPV